MSAVASGQKRTVTVVHKGTRELKELDVDWVDYATGVVWVSWPMAGHYRFCRDGRGKEPQVQDWELAPGESDRLGLFRWKRGGRT